MDEGRCMLLYETESTPYDTVTPPAYQRSRLCNDATGEVMRPIVINGRYLSQVVTGVQRYSIEVVRAMDWMLASGELQAMPEPVEILTPPGTPEIHQFRAMRVRAVGWGSGQVWEQTALPCFCRGKLLFTPGGGAPLLHRHGVYTIHDAGVFATPNAYSPRYGAWYRWHHRRAVRNPSLRLLTVSEFSKRELVRWLGVDAARIQVTPLGHEHALEAAADPAVLERLGLEPQTYILGVGSTNMNKNFHSLLTAFRQLRRLLPKEHAATCHLVVAGGANTRIFKETAVPQPGVIHTGYLHERELRALYENAACFVFPSSYEGFGLPPLEAMTLGCAVACSNSASLPEVCGEAAIFFDSNHSEEMADAMVSLLLDPALRKQMVARGDTQRQQFRWHDTARATWSALLDAARHSV